MSKALNKKTQETLRAIGLYLRELRKLNSKLDYKSYARDEVNIGMNTYLRMEQGSADYNISNLLKVISYYPDFKISEFFEEAGLWIQLSRTSMS